MSAPTPTAFGLALAGDLPAGVRFHTAARRPPRSVRLARVEGIAGAGASGADRSAGVVYVAQRDGGYALSAPGCGACVVAADGRAIAYEIPSAQDASWERLLLDQALPFAACAAGLEALHASGVVLDGRLVAVAGASGAGKSSLALALARRGAAVVADDVLALEPAAGGALLGHPALPRLGVRRAEAERVGEAALAALGAVASRDDDTSTVALPADAAVAPLPLAALYLIERLATPGRLELAPVADPRLVLACSFNYVLATPDRLARLLELCHRLAAHVRLRRVLVPPDVDADALAAALAADAAATGEAGHAAAARALAAS
ncbi:MAG: hypothetical protein ACTHOE_15635 [Conexibacter sp.]